MYLYYIQIGVVAVLFVKNYFSYYWLSHKYQHKILITALCLENHSKSESWISYTEKLLAFLVARWVSIKIPGYRYASLDLFTPASFLAIHWYIP